MAIEKEQWNKIGNESVHVNGNIIWNTVWDKSVIQFEIKVYSFA